MNELDQKEQLLAKITNKLSELNRDELDHVDHVLHALINENDEKMHYYGRFLDVNHLKDRTTLEIGMQHANTYGVVQGGVVLSLVDIAIGHYILNRLEEGESVFTLELKVNFIKKGKGKQLIAIPEIYHWGRTTVVASCKVYDSEGNVTNLAQGTFYIQRNES